MSLVRKGIPKYINGESLFGSDYELKVMKIYVWIL
jgi:hypothetical protein